MRIVVSVGGAIYVIGYVLDMLRSGANNEAFIVFYKIADYVDKIAFVLA